MKIMLKIKVHGRACQHCDYLKQIIRYNYAMHMDILFISLLLNRTLFSRAEK